MPRAADTDRVPVADRRIVPGLRPAREGDAMQASIRQTMAVVAATAVLGIAAPAGATEFHFHGLPDVAASQRGPGHDRNLPTRGDSPFDAHGLRLFSDANASHRIQVFSQVVLRDASTPYVDGAYLMFTPIPARDLHVMAGKLPWAIGTYGPRTYS